MDGFYEFMRSLWSVWLMAVFLGIVIWVMWPSRKRKDQFDAQARIPLEDELPDSRRTKG